MEKELYHYSGPHTESSSFPTRISCAFFNTLHPEGKSRRQEKPPSQLTSACWFHVPPAAGEKLALAEKYRLCPSLDGGPVEAKDSGKWEKRARKWDFLHPPRAGMRAPSLPRSLVRKLKF
ncbi:hypothetical protein IRJ41_015758 [Triplophysa rosa]|uniref:Uncharacterized protein n=1 Tax=Triplophysa rosa TaxID=992332 RepID=A0A9W7TWZ8_TRIRA|nr:hypothetical protein IRJ41_015758 [Triplophysa rosa]